MKCKIGPYSCLIMHPRRSNHCIYALIQIPTPITKGKEKPILQRLNHHNYLNQIAI